MVDANSSWNLHIAHLLNRIEYNAFTVTTSHDMLRMVYGIAPDLILLDVHMPPIGKTTCLEKLRSEGSFEQIRVVLVAQQKDAHIAEDALKRGAQAVLYMPINPTELYTTIHRLIEPHPRKCLRMRVIFKVGVTAGNMLWHLFATVISEQGVFIRTTNPLAEGTEVKLSLELPSPKPIELDGVVAYTVVHDKSQFIEPGMGIKFINTPERVTLGLRKFIENDLTCEFEKETSF